MPTRWTVKYVWPPASWTPHNSYKLLLYAEWYVSNELSLGIAWSPKCEHIVLLGIYVFILLCLLLTGWASEVSYRFTNEMSYCMHYQSC